MCRRTANEADKRLVLYMQIRCVLAVKNTTAVSLLANEFDARSVLHGHVSLVAVNHSM